MTIHLTITTPERTTLKETVDSVSIPTSLGYITVLPHHIPLVAQVAAGELIYRSGSAEESLIVAGGFVQVLGDSVTILADIAERPEEVDIKLVEEAHERAQKLLAEQDFDSVEYATFAAQLERELTRLRIARKRRV